MASYAQKPTSSRQIPQSQRNRIVWKGTVTVGFQIEEQRYFELNPPPDHVASLLLLKAKELSRHEFTHADANLWNSIVSFWSTRLKSLTIDVLQIPPDARLLQLLSSPKLRTLSCTDLQLFDTPVEAGDPLAVPFEFPSCLRRLEEITIFRFDFHGRYKVLFLSELAKSRNLKRLSIRVDDDASLNAVGSLIDTRKNDADFVLSIYHDVCLSDDLDEPYVALVLSIAASSSKIRIFEVKEKKVSSIEERFGESVARKFSECIEVIWEMNDGVERFKNYPNLRDLRRLNLSGGNLASVEFPPKLEGLQIFGDIRSLPNLPGTLTFLILMGYNCTVNELLESLNALSGMCPLLKYLAIHWSSTSSRNPTAAPQSTTQNFGHINNTGNKFPQLKCLEFCGSYSESDGDPLGANNAILLEGFQLPRLSLHELVLRGEIRMQNETLQLKLDSFTLSFIVAGTVTKTLRNVNIAWVSEDADHLLNALTSVVAANNRRDAGL